MTIFLTILKVLGIILLVILGLILLIILLVLFTPISYRISAKHNDEETTAGLRVKFLIIKVLAGYNNIDKLWYEGRILGFKIFPGKDESEDDIGSDDEFGDVMDISDYAEDYAENYAEDYAEDDTTEYIAPDNPPKILEDSGNSDNNATRIEKIEERPVEKKEKIQKESPHQEDVLEERIPITDKIYDKVDDIYDKTDKGLTKLDHISQFLDRPFVEKTIRRVLRIIKRLLGTIKPKKSKGYIRMGLSSSADTGMWLGRISVFYPFYGKWLRIEPDFYNKVLWGDIDIRGRIYLFRFILPVLGMLITRDFWRTYKLFKKI